MTVLWHGLYTFYVYKAYKFYHLPNNVITRSTSSNFPVVTARSLIYR